MKMKEKDLKLLGALYHSNREPLTKIAKDTGLTRIQVEYKLNKFINEGIIDKFVTMFNYSAFGYHVYALLFVKLERYSTFAEFSARLNESSNCISWGECYGKYDLFMNLIFKNEGEMSNFLSGLISHKNVAVSDYLIIKPYVAEFHPLKFFYQKKKITFPLIQSEPKEESLSEKDLEILRILADNARAKVVDIAKETGISAEMVLHNLKKYNNKKIVLGTKAILRMKKLGYNYSIIFLTIKNLSKQLRDDIVNFARKRTRVNALVLSLFNPNCLLQIFHRTDDELKEEVKRIKELLKDELFDLDVILVKEEDTVNTLPFVHYKK